MSVAITALRLKPAIFVCDIQDRFRSAIHCFPEVVATSRKILAAANILDLPVYVTTQSRAKLGNTVSELDVSKAIVNLDKTKFSMYLPELAQKLPKGIPVGIVGIEAHVCVLQTAIDLINGRYSLSWYLLLTP